MKSIRKIQNSQRRMKEKFKPAHTATASHTSRADILEKSR
jgi:hypothetical protein